MQKRNKRLIRIIAIVLAALLVGGVVFGALFSALAEEPNTVGNARRSRQVIDMEYLEDEQALRITQRLSYVNPSEKRLKQVVFYAAGNLFRRLAASVYDGDALAEIYPEGFAPAGIELLSVTCNGEQTDFGFQGEDESFLRADCDLGPGERCEFVFEYYLLLARCGAFQGVGDTDVRLGAFYFVPGVYDMSCGEFLLTRALAFTRWLYCDAADFQVTLTLPRGYEAAATGICVSRTDAEDGVEWRFSAGEAREFAVAFGRRFRRFEAALDSGVRLRVLTNVRGAGRRALKVLREAVTQCEAWFGPFPVDELEVVQSDYPLGALNYPGLVCVPGELLAAGQSKALARQLRFCVAQQYFGLWAYPEPSADAWLSDSVSEYVGCMLLEASEGRDSFLKSVNRDWVSALGQTIPGGLRITSDAALFDAYSYEVVVRQRGAVVLHEMRLAMGRDALLEGLAAFCKMGGPDRTLTEMDFVAALNETGGDWEPFLTDWLFNVGDYVEQGMEWYE